MPPRIKSNKVETRKKIVAKPWYTTAKVRNSAACL